VPDAVTTFAGFSRPFKAPNVDDFASRSSEFQGNISLQPQQSDTYEVGIRAHGGGFETSLTGFYVRVTDEILFVQGVPGNPFIFQNQNVDTRRAGVDGGVRMTMGRLRGSARYLFVDSEFRKGQFADRTLPGTPEHLLHASLGVSPLPGVWVDLDWELVHDVFRYNDVANVLPSDNYGVLNLTAQYALPESLRRRGWPEARAYVKLQNLTNEEYTAFAASNGHTLATGAGENPMPPLGVIGGVDLTF
jgi:outer membrane receptor protein involved in Fe transport